MRGDDLEALVAGDLGGQPLRSARRGGGSSPGSPRRRRGAASSTASARGSGGRAGPASRGSRSPRRPRRPPSAGTRAGCSNAPSSGRPVGRPEQVAVEVDAHPLVRVRAVAVGELEPVVDPAVLGRERGDAAHRRVDVQPQPAAAADRGDRRASGRTPSTTSCRASSRRRTAPARRPGRPSISSPPARPGAIANAASWATMRRCVGADAGDAQPLLDARVRLRRGVGDEARRVAVDVHRPAGRPPPRRQDRRPASPRSPSPGSPRRRRRCRSGSGRAGRAARPSSRASASPARCTPATSPSSCPAPRGRPSSSSPRIDGYDVFDGK